MDGKGNFRKDVATKKVYKGHRNQERPPYFYDVKKLLIEKYNFVVVNGAEADDLLGIAHCALSKPTCWVPRDGELVPIHTKKPLSYIASIDKDLKIINGYHYNLKSHQIWEVRDDWSFIQLTRKGDQYKLSGQGFIFHYSQILTGDSTDNIPGLPRVGAKKTFDLLRHCRTKEQCEEAVRKAYEKHYGEDYKEHLEEQRKLVKILTKHHTVPSLVIQDFNNRGMHLSQSQPTLF